MSTSLLLLRTAHGGPALAVTAVAGLIAFGAGHTALGVGLVVTVVLTGQLVIGWSNDLLDAGRDAQVLRVDKPLATGALSAGLVTRALAAAAVGCVALSLSLGVTAGLTHLVVVVGSGVAYNLGLKGTWWSWLPYATAFGALPAVATLSLPTPAFPAAATMVAGALLGVGAHLVNVLPDLADDAATGVRGLPHRLGGRGSQRAATAVLLTASAVVVAGAGRPVPAGAWLVLGLTVALGVVALWGRGRTPFHAAVAIALLDVVLFTVLT